MMRHNRYQLYSKALEYFGEYDSKLDPRLKLEFSLMFLTTGLIGACVSNKSCINILDLNVWLVKRNFYVRNILWDITFDTSLYSKN